MKNKRIVVRHIDKIHAFAPFKVTYSNSVVEAIYFGSSEEMLEKFGTD
jgi:hypothetical protein